MVFLISKFGHWCGADCMQAGDLCTHSCTNALQPGYYCIDSAMLMHHDAPDRFKKYVSLINEGRTVKGMGGVMETISANAPLPYPL